MVASWRSAARRSACGPILLLLIVGCGVADEYGQRFPIAGKVTLDDRPLATGDVVFTPTGDGPTVQAKIIDGAYAVGTAEGPTAGTYRVEIYSVQPTGEKVFDRGEGEVIEQTKDLIPPTYNVSSTLQAVVRTDGERTFDFSLKSAAAEPRSRRRR